MEYNIYTRLGRPTYVNSTTIARNVWGIEWSTEATDANDAMRKFLNLSGISSKRFSELDRIVAVLDGKEEAAFISDKIIVDDTVEDIINKGLGHDILSRTIEETTRTRP